MAKYYFRDDDNENCFQKSAIIDQMKDEGLTELKVFEAERYDCSILRIHNWKRRTPYGWWWNTHYWRIDTIRHIQLWKETGHYDWWNY